MVATVPATSDAIACVRTSSFNEVHARRARFAAAYDAICETSNEPSLSAGAGKGPRAAHTHQNAPSNVGRHASAKNSDAFVSADPIQPHKRIGVSESLGWRFCPVGTHPNEDYLGRVPDYPGEATGDPSTGDGGRCGGLLAVRLKLARKEIVQAEAGGGVCGLT